MLADPSPSPPRTCDKSVTATQNATTLSLDSADAAVPREDKASLPATTSRDRVINFDGTDTRESFPAPAPRPSTASPGTWIGTAVSSVSRAEWNGDQLVVVTHRTMTFTWPINVPPEFERQITTREALSLNASGRLVIDRTVIVDPLPGGTSVRLDLPTSWTCTYRKAG